MGKTDIEWARNEDGSKGETWNPIAGCSILSPGCTNCYAMKMAHRIEMMGAGLPTGRRNSTQYDGTTKLVNDTAVWTGKIGYAPASILLRPLKRKKPTTYFVNSMSDLFHDAVPDAVIDHIFAIMALCPQHTFQVLTKRTERMRQWFSADRSEIVGLAMLTIVDRIPHGHRRVPWPLPNVWLGVSTERQKEADERIPLLLQTPAAVRFISAEPLLGPLDVSAIKFNDEDAEVRINALTAEAWVENSESAAAYTDENDGNTKLDWIIAGGESGPDARPTHPDWIRALRDQCAAAGVPFFFKQWGSWFPYIDRDRDDPDWRANYSRTNSQPERYQILNFAGGTGFHGERVHLMERRSKKAAGRLLDGVEHLAMPTDHKLSPAKRRAIA